ncbi:XRE family transcriptional regulator [Mesorhizobium sp. B3-1-6]|uniref:helix-turn-helix domain-containing protein n=1 Tax=unclassified Mesorhizobium TaxID=325217 RepID=UPI00112EB864|nr:MULTISPECIES: XRE family transcriptional regulator [unclassified Mesorhizobium]TPI36148.1 XRE family transcriptional regulator [Mesorhizobium sp. B3-1-6]TPI53372.1 XRE family transcriptional regulator [Mesorhizobium sp. B3-1-7]TPI70855.1 XRE family transcriptional regulator [Mesorhizobium sp. B3-1-8]TPI74389.1 XRE family transcriptional regulator [Mesorhizobium sp. B3-1-3]TPJ31928.1 XRE family transcriptional regulator [Mesorhizobium sp. B2-8-3]
MDNIRPIKTEADYDWAIAEITRYFDKEPVPGTPDADRFDVLAELIEAYETKHYPIAETDPVDAITAHMEMANLSRQALIKLLGSASRASEILARKRALTMDMAFKLNREWHIPAEVLIVPYHLADQGNTKDRKAAARA